MFTACIRSLVRSRVDHSNSGIKVADGSRDSPRVRSSHMGMRRRKTDNPTFLGLPLGARVYVAAVVKTGAACLITAALHVRFEQSLLFVMLLALAVVTSAAKIELPLGRSQSNLSLSHAVNFWSLFALGPADAVCIAAISAWAQCTLRAGGRNPLHRTVFSIASLTVTVAVAGLPLVWFGGTSTGDIGLMMRGAAMAAP